MGEEREASRRAEARQRITLRRDFGWHAITFLVVNGLLVFVWSINGGGFWPAWVMVAWGIGLVFHAWYAFVGRPVTEDDVSRELDKHRSRRRGSGRRTP